MLRICLSAFVVSLFFIACDATQAALKKFDPRGSWDYTVKNTPMGDFPGVMMLDYTKEDGWTGKLTSDQGEIVLNDIEMEDKNLSAVFDFQGTQIDWLIEFNGDSEMTGQAKTDMGDAFDVVGKKQ